MGDISPDDEFMLKFELDSQESSERLHRVLREAGRPDLIAEYDAKMRDIRNGVVGAQSTWHSISETQRRVLKIMAMGYHLARRSWSKTAYEGYGPPKDAFGKVCDIRTVRALCGRELLAPDGPALDPEKRIVLTERGRFVVRHGPLTAPDQTP